jgi:hypothetical protein
MVWGLNASGGKISCTCPDRLWILFILLYNGTGSLSLTFWHRSFTFNSNKSPTWSNNFSIYYPEVCLHLNIFRAFSRPSSGAQWLQAWPWTQHDCHHDTKVKPEAATAVIELMIMGGKKPETCWDVNKLQDNKLKNCCFRLVIYLNCTIMHRLTNLKVYI